MFKFGGWKATLNLGSSGGRHREVYENGPDLSVGGAYRVHREEFFGRTSLSQPPKKLSPSMVKLPPSNEALKNSKSSNDLSNQYNLPPQLRKSTPDVSTEPRGGTTQNRDSSALHRNAKNKSSSKNTKKDKKQEKDKKAEKKRIAEEKKREKLAMQEQAKQDKLRIQRDKQIAQQQAKDVKAKKEQEKKGNKKKTEPSSLPQTSVKKTLVSRVADPQAPIPPPPQPLQRANPLGQQSHSTNTLESSISRNSGPPPYSELPNPPEKQPNKKDATGNTSFGKPVESSSWDLISAHRQQMSRNPVASGSSTKQMTMDLKFSLDTQAKDNKNSDV